MVFKIVLVCNESENIRRMKLDNRDEERIKRALKFSRPVYDELDLVKLDISELTPRQAALDIIDTMKLQ